ncbi:MAG: hypothetical protein AAFV07_03680 [Bacteroidota bacterium]
MATFVYAKNIWIQTSPNGALFGDQNGNLALGGTLSLVNGTTVNEFSTDATLANNSNLKVPTEQAVRGYVDNLITKQSQTGISADGAMTVSVPAGYRIRSLVLAETGNASPGPIQIGTSSGGSQVVQNYVLTAGDLGDCTPLRRVFSLTQNQGLFISSSNWNGGVVSVYLNLEKIN